MPPLPTWTPCNKIPRSIATNHYRMDVKIPLRMFTAFVNDSWLKITHAQHDCALSRENNWCVMGQDPLTIKYWRPIWSTAQLRVANSKFKHGPDVEILGGVKNKFINYLLLVDGKSDRGSFLNSARKPTSGKCNRRNTALGADAPNTPY